MFAVVGAGLLAACGEVSSASSASSASSGSSASSASSAVAAAAVPAATGAGLRTLAPPAVQQHLRAAPARLTVLDVRTPEEFATGHLAGATLLDFYASGFQESLAALDRDTPYVLVCRSGNRSALTLALMRRLGFRDVVEVDGGMLAWTAARLPVVTGG